MRGQNKINVANFKFVLSTCDRKKSARTASFSIFLEIF